MQFPRTSVVVQSIRRVRLLLCLHDDRPWPKRMYSSASDVNHVALIYVDPVQQILGTLLVNRSFQLRRSHARLQAKSNLGARLSVSHIPALGLSPRLADTQGLLVIG